MGVKERLRRFLGTVASREIPTPCLIVDLPAVERNIATAVEELAHGRTKLRPHYKAHKCTSLMRRQVDAGMCVGVTCATAEEALGLAEAGFDDVLVANEVVDTSAVAILCRAAALARICVAVDDLIHVRILDEAATAAGVRFDVLIEIDVGLHRCGLPPGAADLLELARAIGRAPSLGLRGLQGYEGHAVLRQERAERQQLVTDAARLLAHERRRLESAGFECAVVSGGGTGTLDMAVAAGVLTEVQAGSYVLMDRRYSELDIPFRPALYCCSTVISRRGDRVVLDAGLKSMSAEHGLPLADEIEVLDLSDEHASARLNPGYHVAVGDRILLLPNHVDPTVNLHDVLVAIDNTGGIHTWLVDGRRLLVGRTAVQAEVPLRA